MKILVTGARGFIGKVIVEKLRGNNLEVLELHSRWIKKEFDLNNNQNYKVRADLTNKNEVLQLAGIGKIDAVVHAAGLAHQFENTKREEFELVNSQGTENILELGKLLKIKHFILISSVSVYGNEEKSVFDSQGITEDTECHPKDFYAESKFASEIVAQRFYEKADFDLTILRLATVIGEEDRGNFLRLIKSIDKRRFLWIGKGHNYKSLIHREDVAGAVRKILFENLDAESTPTEKIKKMEIFNVSAEPLLMSEIVEVISDALNKRVPGISINKKIVETFFAFNSATIKNNKIEKKRKTVEKWLSDDAYSALRLKRKYQFETQITIQEAIRREVKWYLQQ